MTTQAVQALHVRGLEKSYGKLRVLRGVDFEVARGSCHRRRLREDRSTDRPA